MANSPPFVEAGYRFTPYKPIEHEQKPGAVADPRELWAVEITTGKFTGLKYVYSDWKIQEEVDPISFEKKHRMNFKYDVLPTSEKEEPNVAADKLEMQSLMGNILLNILVEVARLEWPKNELKD